MRGWNIDARILYCFCHSHFNNALKLPRLLREIGELIDRYRYAYALLLC